MTPIDAVDDGPDMGPSIPTFKSNMFSDAAGNRGLRKIVPSDGVSRKLSEFEICGEVSSEGVDCDTLEDELVSCGEVDCESPCGELDCASWECPRDVDCVLFAVGEVLSDELSCFLLSTSVFLGSTSPLSESDVFDSRS